MNVEALKVDLFEHCVQDVRVLDKPLKITYLL